VVIPEPKDVVEKVARELLQALIDLPRPPMLRVANADGWVACLLQARGVSHPSASGGCSIAVCNSA
jgi:hypothetical protein